MTSQSRHRAIGKNSGKTNLIERFNCTLRQRVSRLVRDTLSFSKKLDNHIGAIWYARTSLQLILTFVGLPYYGHTTGFDMRVDSMEPEKVEQ